MIVRYGTGSAGRVGLVTVALLMAACNKSSGASGGGPGDASPHAPPPPPLSCSQDGGDWPMFGQNICNTRASQGGPITPATVGKLAVKWQLDMAGDVSATPAVVGGQLYVPDWSGMVSRIDLLSHTFVWSRSVADILGVGADAGVDSGASDASDDAAPASGSVDAGTAGVRGTFGLLARDTPVVVNGLVVFGVASPPSALMVAVDQSTGALRWQKALDTHPSALVAASPAYDDGKIYVGVSSGEEGATTQNANYVCCTFRGSVAALDASTGAVLWQTPMIDDDVYYKPDHTPSGYAGAAVWSSTPTIDRNRGLLYVTTGNNYSVPAGVADSGLPLPVGDRLESIVALDLKTGKIRWSQRMTHGDVWQFGNFSGPDWDFGCGANLFQVTTDAGVRDFVGAGQKSGVYWAVDADTGLVQWHKQVGPGGHLGGIHWGTAVDGTRVYVGVNDESGTAYTLGGKGAHAGEKTSVGSWAALDPATGETLWQTADPALTAPLNLTSVNGPVTVVNGVVFGGSMDMDGTMYALDSSSGEVLWSFKSGATVYSGPAIAGGVVYWGNGYPPARLGFGTTGHTLYAFATN